jgi:peptide/nickel transport system substrate-binding protein
VDEPGSRHIKPDAMIRTFLIADIRGYTLFTQDRGDETAAKLASRFAELTKEGVEARDGELIELRGDEALAVFRSARQAIRAAVGLQTRFVEETLGDPSLPLPVGIGLDAGEAVPVGDGYRGDALNLAARLCGQAGPGEVLASQEVVHLARRVEGVRYIERGELHLRGLSQPVRAVKVLPEDSDPAVQLAPFVPRALPHPLPRLRGIIRRPRSARQLITVALLLVLVAAGIPLLLTLRGGEGLAAIGENAVGLIDLDSGRLVASIPVGEGPAAIAAGEGSVWVLNRSEATVTRIDPAERRLIDTIPVGTDPSGIAVGHGAVWVANTGDGTVSRINPDTNTVVDEIAVGNGPRDVAIANDGVLVANSYDNAVVRIDPKVNKVAGAPFFVAAPIDIAVGHDSLWVASATGSTISRIDLSSGGLVPIPVGKGPSDIAVGEDSVWVANTLDGTVSRIDPSNDGVVGTSPVGESPVGLAVSAEAVWTTDELGLIHRIDPSTNTAKTTIQTGEALAGSSVAHGFLWVTSRGSPTAHFGGTLTAIDVFGFPASIDPAFEFTLQGDQIFAVVGDGLVGARRVGGAEGYTLVPDLATSLPPPTNDGTTYRFTVRRGIKYSNGGVVKPSDFLRAAERTFKTNTKRRESCCSFAFAKILGADACAERPARCDLSEGIIADDVGYTVTFNLTAPDPDLFWNLTGAFAFPVPEGVPNREVGTTAPIPGTGPYRIIEYVKPREAGKGLPAMPGRIELERNPYFQEWSKAAQPNGFPDRIIWVHGKGEHGVNLEDAVDDVIKGEADYVNDVPKNRVGGIRSQFTRQYHEYLMQGLYHFFLNTSEPPFDDLRVRRAVNYAVDRNRVLELYPDPARIACQVIPPNFPGHRPYCPYTINPDGAWTAPDLAMARKLVKESGTARTKVAVRGLPIFEAVTRYFADVLQDLGYRTSVEIIELSEFDYVLDSRNQVQTMGFWLVGVSFPSLTGWIDWFTCDWFVPADPSKNSNPSEYCNKEVDAMIEKARELERTDLAAAGDLWARIDRTITDEAPWVVLLVPGGRDFLSERVGNYQYNPRYGMLLSQLWVT